MATPGARPARPKGRCFWKTLGALLGLSAAGGAGAAVSQAEADTAAAIVIGTVAAVVGFVIYRRMKRK